MHRVLQEPMKTICALRNPGAYLLAEGKKCRGCWCAPAAEVPNAQVTATFLPIILVRAEQGCRGAWWLRRGMRSGHQSHPTTARWSWDQWRNSNLLISLLALGAKLCSAELAHGEAARPAGGGRLEPWGGGFATLLHWVEELQLQPWVTGM